MELSDIESYDRFYVGEHFHMFQMKHEIPLDYMTSYGVCCNWCNDTIVFRDEYIKSGFLHCTRKYSDEFTETCLITDLTVEDLYKRRLYLKLEWMDCFGNERFQPHLLCQHDLCWKCYFMLKKKFSPSAFVYAHEC